MANDPRIDDYLAKAPEFARPILTHLRAIVHRALPGAEETIKWGMPHFMVGGRNIAGMAAFKAHVGFVIHGQGRQGRDEDVGLGQYGKIATLADLPPDAELVARLREQRDLLGAPRPPRAKAAAKAEIAVPDDFAAALSGNPAAQTTLAGLAPSHRREYLEWIIQAKRPETRAKRIAEAVRWLAEGKRRNWKYEGC